MLETKPLRRASGTRKDYDQAIAAHCQECTVGCGLLAYVKDERIVDVQGLEDHPVSRGRLCAKGIAFVQGLTSPERLTWPGTRNRLSGPFEAFDHWEKGIDLLAERLRRVKDLHGSESLVIGCGPEAGLDFFLGAKRFARLWGTPHVYHPWEDSLDAGEPEVRLPITPCTEWPRSRGLFLIEADLAWSHPVSFGWLLEAQRQGTKICAVDTCYTTTLSKADLAAVIRPQSGNLLGLALMKIFIEEGLCPSSSNEDSLVDRLAWQASFQKMDLADVEQNIGLSREKLKAMARFLSHHSPVTLITGKRLTLYPYQAIWPTMAGAMRWMNPLGGGWYPLESGMPDLEATYDSFVVKDPSRDIRDSAPDDVTARAMICTGNCLNDFLVPFQPRVKEMDLVAYWGMFPNRTRELAHMVFPAAAWAERDGLFFTNDRAIQWCRRIVRPSPACRSGLDFWISLSARFGWEKHFPWKKETGLADHRAFYDWVLNQCPQTAGCRVDQLGDVSQITFWPGQGEKAAPGILSSLYAPSALEPACQPEEADRFPLWYQATRLTSRYSDASHWWPWIREFEPDKAVWIHPEVGRALRIENGDAVVVAGLRETWEGFARISRSVEERRVWSSRKSMETRVLIYKPGQTRKEARDLLKATLS